MTQFDRTFTDIKTELTRRHNSTKHFTRDFFKVYIKALNDINHNSKIGIETGYYDGNLYTRHEYDEIRKTRFYNENGCSYCEFLSIAYNNSEIKKLIAD